MEAGCVDLRRRQFLRGAAGRPQGVVRPPWAGAENGFAATCTRCERCLPACPAGLVVRGSGGYPELAFDRGGCTLCGDCVRACETGALRHDPAAACPPWNHRVRLLSSCLAVQGVVCRSCADACPERAIRFRLQPGGRAFPELTTTACTGCGACLSPCPVQAVVLDFSATEQSA